MAVTHTGGVQTGTAEWAIYAALKQGGTLLSTDGLDDLATSEGVISVSATSYVTFGLSIEFLGVSGKHRDVHTYSSALIALSDALDDWTNNLISALEQ